MPLGRAAAGGQGPVVARPREGDNALINPGIGFVTSNDSTVVG
jgi:hypothetical protein